MECLALAAHGRVPQEPEVPLTSLEDRIGMLVRYTAETGVRLHHMTPDLSARVGRSRLVSSSVECVACIDVAVLRSVLFQRVCLHAFFFVFFQRFLAPPEVEVDCIRCVQECR